MQLSSKLKLPEPVHAARFSEKKFNRPVTIRLRNRVGQSDEAERQSSAVDRKGSGGFCRCLTTRKSCEKKRGQWNGKS
ncbi:hypothetical protein RJT34_00301 [Clitoria ternatea]|uniref:Uncharacterized protein n=1 Tax=Clitoria ternatea TaxID=43366 RepID=A0AAN9Q2L6_CLITE